jgi:hypothetical protein
LLDEDGLFANIWGCPLVGVLAGAPPVPQCQLPAGMAVPPPPQALPIVMMAAPLVPPLVVPTGQGGLPVKVTGDTNNGGEDRANPFTPAGLPPVVAHPPVMPAPPPIALTTLPPDASDNLPGFVASPAVLC